MKNGKTIFQSAVERGVSRRDFLKICTVLAATMGLDFKDSTQVVHALETKEKVPVIWLQFQDCTGCSESFIRSEHPSTEHLLLDMISLEYSEVLSAASGTQVNEALEEVFKKYPKGYLLAVEGSIPKDGAYCMVGGEAAADIYEKFAANALAIVAVGSCASWGGIAGAKPNPTGASPVTSFSSGGTPVLLVPGCPPIAETITGVIGHYLTFDRLPEVDLFGRPKGYYKHRIHDKCNRRAFFDSGLFVESFDDDGAKNGYCLYKMGCKGPTTYAPCMELRWNGGVSNPILSGNPCIGCTEKNFWDNGSFHDRLTSVPGTQTTLNPDKVGGAIAAAATAGVLVHGALTAVNHNKNKDKNETIKK